MNFIRQMVSMNKNRYTDDSFDLDLTYITPRVIAMAFPAAGFESIFRNKISDVARLLNERHENHFLIINASNRSYDYSKFNHSVIALVWPNHYPCPLSAFASAISDSVLYLAQNDRNAVVVHCLAGKGRTGSLIDAILFASGEFESIEDANEFYRRQRAVNVTHPSQLRYLKYFERFFNEGTKGMRFRQKTVKSVFIETKRKSFFANSFFLVQISDFSGEEKILCELELDGNNLKVVKPNENEKENSEQPSFRCKAKVHNWVKRSAVDILITVRIITKVSATKLFRANFNFVFCENGLSLGPNDVDKPINLPDDFRFAMKFEELDDLEMEKENERKFLEAQKKLDMIRMLRKKPKFGSVLLFGNEEEDWDRKNGTQPKLLCEPRSAKKEEKAEHE